jgi:uncharacterized protein (TIGR02611 family)
VDEAFVRDQRDVGGQVGTEREEAAGRDEADPPRPDEAEAPLRRPFRAFFARHRTLDLAYRVAVGVVGVAIVLGGIVLIPLPGPGWLIVFAGLAVLATEFAWAGRLLDFARSKVMSWTGWVTEQSVAVRALIGLVSMLVVAGAVWLYVAVQGVPGWLPLV